jgi:hypothetical protein
VELSELIRVFGPLQGDAVERDAAPLQRAAPPARQAATPTQEAELERLRERVQFLERELEVAREREGRLFNLAEQRALPAPSWWNKLFGAQK